MAVNGRDVGPGIVQTVPSTPTVTTKSARLLLICLVDGLKKIQPSAWLEL